MIKTLLIIPALLFVFLVPQVATAAYDPYLEACNSGSDRKYDPAAQAAACQEKGTNPLYGSDGVINKVATGIVLVGSSIAVIFMIMGGYKMMLANGDSTKFSAGKNTMIYASVGLVVFVLAKALVSFVVTRIGV